MIKDYCDYCKKTTDKFVYENKKCTCNYCGQNFCINCSISNNKTLNGYGCPKCGSRNTNFIK